MTRPQKTTSHFDATTNEHVIVLANGWQIRSGWVDHDDPDALRSGDYLSLVDEAEQQLFYTDSADLLADPIEGRRLLNQLFEICCGGFSEAISNNETGEETKK